MSIKPDMWRDKPEREARTTSFHTLDFAPARRGFPMWGKVAAVVLVVVALLLTAKTVMGW